MMNFTFGVVQLSEYGRKNLAGAFNTISSILGILSMTLIINAFYIMYTVAPTLYTEKAIIQVIFTIIGMLATQLLLYYVVGIYVCRKCHNEAYRKNSRYLLRIWTFSGYSTLINVVIIGSMSAGCSNHIIRSMHHSMTRGMKEYLNDISWKEIIDVIQYRYQCCGSTEYTDWHEISWLSIWHLTSSGYKKNYKKNGDSIFFNGVPWSCCKLDYDKQCFHDPIQQSEFVSNWKKLHEESVNNIGCIEILRKSIEYSFIYFIFITYIIFIFQIILSILSRYLYTSHKNAIILGDPFGISPGWIISFKTASEIMADKRSISTCPKSGGRSSRSHTSMNECRARSCPHDRSSSNSADSRDPWKTYYECRR